VQFHDQSAAGSHRLGDYNKDKDKFDVQRQMCTIFNLYGAAMNKIKAIGVLLRAPFLTVTLGAVLIGTAFAKWETGAVDWGLFLITLFGASCLHIATNVANDYFDHKAGTDALNRSGTSPFSGGSGMVLKGFVKPGEALAVAFVFSAVGSAAGLYLNAISRGNIILFIGIGALFLVYNYNGWPLRLVNYGLGELGIFLAWGPLMVFGAYYVQTQEFGSVWILGPAYISGVLTTLVLLINEFADRDADKGAGRKTLVVLLGYDAGLAVYFALAASSYAVATFGWIVGKWPTVSLTVFLTGFLPLQAYRMGRRNIGSWPDFLGSVKATILMNLLFLAILSLSFVM
jgi:1,4-dihydroxy-2-naphthoate octaprenyltransferase